MPRPHKKSPKKPLHRDPREYSEVIRNNQTDASWLHSFIVLPHDIHFDTQDPEEHILLVLRRHFITNAPWLLMSLIGLFIPLVATYTQFFYQLPESFQLLLPVIWYLFLFGFSLEQFLSWYFHVYIITDERLIDYDFYSLLFKRVTEAKLDRIEDVTYQSSGILQTFIAYGSVYIQTAGEKREIDFDDVPRPDLVTKLLNELILEEEREKIEGRVR